MDFHAEFGKIGVEATDKGPHRALFIWLAGAGEGIERFLRRLRQRDIAVEVRRFRIFLELVQLLENLIGRISVFVELIITTDRCRERPRELDLLGQGIELHNFDHKVGGDGGVHGSGQRRVLLDQRIALELLALVDRGGADLRGQRSTERRAIDGRGGELHYLGAAPLQDRHDARLQRDLQGAHMRARGRGARPDGLNDVAGK